jgi:ATP-dependent DNA helicase DinG
LHATHGGIWLATAEGTRVLGRGEAISFASETPTLLLNAPMVAARLGLSELSGLDLLELYAFVHPARFVVPTPAGIARALGLEPPKEDALAAAFLRQAAAALLGRLADKDWPEREGAWTSAQSLGRLRWPWANLVAPLIDKPAQAERWLFSKLPQWDEAGPRPDPRPHRLGEEETLARLAHLVGDKAEVREGQKAYAASPAGRGRDRDRQDARLSRPGLAPRRACGRAGLGLDLH